MCACVCSVYLFCSTFPMYSTLVNPVYFINKLDWIHYSLDLVMIHFICPFLIKKPTSIQFILFI